jgi:hypothetical protein
LPLYSTYIVLQMADQSHRFPEGIAWDWPVKIKDHYVVTDFLVIDMGDEQDPPIVLGRSFLNTTRATVYIGTDPLLVQNWKGMLLLQYLYWSWAAQEEQDAETPSEITTQAEHKIDECQEHWRRD